MSHIDRVVDYMSGLPQTSEHSKTYATEFAERVAQREETVIDGVAEEKKMVSQGEREVIARLQCQVKFTRHLFGVGFGLSVAVNAESTPHVRRQARVEVDFLGSREWFLDAACSDALYSAKESTLHLLDMAQKKRILAMCPVLSGEEANDVYLMSVHERISVPQDFRHIMMKMYLILQDYNLGVTSKSNEVSYAAGIGYSLVPNARALDRFSAVTNHRIVIDGDTFTSSELSLLALAGLQYPSVWYTTDNMYSKCNMAADDLIIVSNGDININRSMLWGSPDRLYQMIWTIAAKLDAIPSLISAFEGMRGKCKMAADIVSRTSTNRFNSMVPLSYNMVTAFGAQAPRFSVTNMPGYFSSSMGLVSDLLYGMCFEAVASCVGESLGGCGTLLSAAVPATNPVINGIMREYGLKHSSAEENFLLRNWDMLSGRPITWDFGTCLKEYVLELCGEIINGSDILLPQLLHLVPGLRAVNTAYGLARGWRGPAGTLSSKKERAMDGDGLAAFSWMMGCRATRPRVFFNRTGLKETMHTSDEQELATEMNKGFGIGMVGFWLTDDVGGRVDENEETSSGLYRTEYAGTKCALVYNYNTGSWVEHVKPEPPGRQSMKGRVPIEESTPPGPPPPLSGVNWGGARNSGDKKQLFNRLATISRSNQIVPSAKPRHWRVASTGETAVPSYLLNGSEESVMLQSRRTDFQEGMKFDFSRIGVPGDGQCGIHAIVEDLKSHGMLSAGDSSRAEELFSQETMSKSFHDAQELAAAATKWGMNLDLIDKESRRVTRYGKHDGHTLSILRDGIHFEAFTPGGPETIEIAKVDEQELPNEEFVRQVMEEYGSLFGKPLQ